MPCDSTPLKKNRRFHVTFATDAFGSSTRHVPAASATAAQLEAVWIVMQAPAAAVPVLWRTVPVTHVTPCPPLHVPPLPTTCVGDGDGDGDAVGDGDGDAVGAGVAVGACVGTGVGRGVGTGVGATVGSAVRVGLEDGDGDGEGDGEGEGEALGVAVAVGFGVGDAVARDEEAAAATAQG